MPGHPSQHRSTLTARERFEHPDAWHMPAAYWFWHHLPDERQIRQQVGEMQDAGILSFQVQARMAYPLEAYLDEDYLAACRIAVDEASRRGMTVGVYDDYNWQSGHAGGRAVAGHDELREQQLFWASGWVHDGLLELTIDDIHSSSESMGDAGMAWHYDRGVLEWDDWTVRFAITGAADEITNATSIVEQGVDGCRVDVDAPTLADGTRVTVFVSARCTTSRLINYMERSAVERFVEAGYQPFHDALGDYFGGTVRYFFFDQPHANFYQWAQHHGDLGSSMPYADDMDALILERWPERYAEVLLALLEGDSAEELALRAQFYAFYGARQAEIFFGTARAWTRSKGVLFTGHEVLAHVGRWDLGGAFSGWDLRVNFGLDYFSIDSYRDLTSVDAQDSNPQLSAKMGDSVARSNGRSGTIVEQYFGTTHTAPGVYAGHWGLTLDEMRALALRHHILGMRQFLFHGFYQTDGFDDDPRSLANPRFDFPPGHNFEPWFARHHADFAIESGRLSEFLDDLAPVCDVAVLYPLRTVWTDTQGGPHAAEAGAWFERLALAGYGYHIVSEDDLLTASTRDGKLVIGGRAYRALILPGARSVISRALLERIGVFADGGVRVVASGATPSVYERGPQTAVDDWAALATGSELVHLTDPPAQHDLAGLLGAPGLGAITVVTDGEAPLWWRAGSAGSEWRLVLFNDQPGSVAATFALPDGVEGFEEWPLDGSEPVALPTHDRRATVTVDPMQLLLLVASDGHPGSPATGDDGPAWSAAEPIEGPWTLGIPAGQHRYSGQVIEIDPTIGWERQGFDEFAGTGVYSVTLQLDPGREYRIELPAVAGSVILAVDGVEAGRRGWTPYVFTVTPNPSGTTELALAIASHAANRYYARTPWRQEPEPAGILARPVIRSRPHPTKGS